MSKPAEGCTATFTQACTLLYTSMRTQIMAPLKSLLKNHLWTKEPVMMKVSPQMKHRGF